MMSDSYITIRSHSHRNHMWASEFVSHGNKLSAYSAVTPFFLFFLGKLGKQPNEGIGVVDTFAGACPHDILVWLFKWIGDRDSSSSTRQSVKIIESIINAFNTTLQFSIFCLEGNLIIK